MTNNRIACLAFAGFICASFPALAEDAISHPASKTIGASSSEMVASLGVINADGASLEGNKLTLTACQRTPSSSPIAPKGPYNLTMRIYAPSSDALTGKWTPPPVTKSATATTLPQ